MGIEGIICDGLCIFCLSLALCFVKEAEMLVLRTGLQEAFRLNLQARHDGRCFIMHYMLGWIDP